MLGKDFYVYWQIGKAVLAGLDPYSVTDSFYPPATSLLFALLSLLPFTPAFALWTGAGAVVFWDTLRRLKLPLIWFGFTPTIFLLMTGQMDIFFLWLAGFLPAGGWAAVVAGGLITLKPQLAFVILPWFLVRWAIHERILLARWVGFCVLLHLLPLLYDPTLYTRWLTAVQGETGWRLLASPGLFALTNLKIPLVMIAIIAVVAAIWSLWRDQLTSRAAQLLALPGGLWYNSVLLTGAAPWWLLVPLSWVAFILAVLFQNSLPLALIPLGAFVWLVARSTQARLPSPAFSALLVGCLLAGLAAPVQAGRVDPEIPGPYAPPAQTDPSLNVFPADASKFPDIRIQFEAYDSAGSFIDVLEPKNILLQEDSVQRPVDSIEKIQPGLQVTAAFNLGPTLGLPVGNQTQLTRITQSLKQWANSRPANLPDEFSLSSNNGLDASHLKTPSQWAGALADFQPDLQKPQPNLVALTQALDLAADANASAGMKQIVFFITPALPKASATSLPNLTNRARQVGARVFVWMVSPSPTPDTESALPLRQLADGTGGQFLVVSGESPLPDIETYLAPLRNVYELHYSSRIRESGTHQVELQLDYQNKKSFSKTQSFTLNVQAPNPIFLAPPSQVQRMRPAETPQAGQKPEPVQLSIVIEFPDGFQRPIAATRLFVNGALVAENRGGDFTQFNWYPDLSASLKRNVLRVEVEDILGMTRSSIDTPVDVTVEEPVRTWNIGHFSGYGLVAVGVMVGGGLLVVAVLVLGDRALQWKWYRKRKQKKKENTQPLPIAALEKQPNPLSKVVEPRRWLHISSGGHAQAFLTRLGENDKPVPGIKIDLNRKEITFGRDSQKSLCVLDSPSVDGLHARMQHTGENDFILSDAGSVAGTWINFTPVDTHGTRLVHGDLIHFGRLAYRFEQANPDPLPKPIVVLEEKK